MRKIKHIVMKHIEEEVHDQDKEAHLEYLRQQIKLIKAEK